MSDNPYAPPATHDPVTVANDPARDRALAALRGAFLILLLPALFNYCAFDARMIAGSRPSLRAQRECRAVNLGLFAIGGALIWFAGLPLLERGARLIRRAFAGGCRPP